jgi:hypothetical protein
MVETVITSETSANFCETTRRDIPEQLQRLHSGTILNKLSEMELSFKKCDINLLKANGNSMYQPL